MAKEKQPAHFDTLPRDLRQFLREQEYAFLLHESNHGTLFLLKAPETETCHLNGTLPVRLTHQVFSKPTAPVIRTMLNWYDYRQSHLSFETFTNIADPDQEAPFARLGRQDSVVTLCYTDKLDYPLQKRITNGQQKQIPQMLRIAHQLKATIPDDEYDFDLAKQRVIESTRME